MSENVFSRDAFQRSTPLNREPRLEAEQFSTFAHGALALLLLIVLVPLLLFVALAIAVEDGGPVVFAHRRLGRYGRSFDCLKFRTMAKDAEERLTRLLEVDPAAREEWERDRKLRKDPRITPLGSILRRSSLDELPQLINVLRGEMSLVGPRPIVQAEVARYGSRIRHYYSVKPGITGLWQVSGRSDVSYRTRVAMDCLYARNRSLLLDGWLLVLTVPAVLFRRGCY
jgi:lipopolysaccharide/colanic/teichoic acid biosynthesis glycosyltransferase